jgi:hypothetical protein
MLNCNSFRSWVICVLVYLYNKIPLLGKMKTEITLLYKKCSI